MPDLPMPDLKDELAALRIEREPQRAGAGRWIGWTVLLLALAAAGVAGWRCFTRERPVDVETATVSERAAGTQAAVLNASGYVTARRRATVSSKITGKVIEVNVEEGMAVREGQVLARLDDATSRAALALAEAQAEAARRAVRENEVRLAEAQRVARPRAAAGEGSARRRRPKSTRRRRKSIRSTRGSRAAREQVRVAGAAGRARTDQSRQHGHPRAVQRRRDFQGRAAGRDGVAGLGRRRLHPHRHLHDRRHAVARDRSRRQRELHQPRAAGSEGHARSSTRIPTGRFRRSVITTVPTADRQKATVLVRIGFEPRRARVAPSGVEG